ncbi:MAG: amino acid permease [Acidobacteria bacterium]|nr:amino acid permease [Acidobacteriota bacterium]
MIDMVGIGPFITLPLIIAAMGGPQALVGWILGALISVCDGLVWAELGAAFPGSGGSYLFLREIYGREKLGRLMSFLFIWMVMFSAPLSIASGAIGFSQYMGYLWRSMSPLEAKAIALGMIALVLVLLYRRITTVGKISVLLWLGVIGTCLWIIVSGMVHFDASRAFGFTPKAFSLTPAFFLGLSSASLYAVYDYWGYYNVCFIGDEIKDPARNIPRAIILSVLGIAAIYLCMQVSIISVIPWQEAARSTTIASDFIERLYGHTAARFMTVLILWTAFASVFSLLLGYSRVPYAAASKGEFFSIFSRLHPKGAFPHVALLTLGMTAMIFSLRRLQEVITALVLVRILLQFLSQTVGVMVLRKTRPELPRPFKMALYPAPALVSLAGFIYILVARTSGLDILVYAVGLLVFGVAIYMIRAFRKREWPFSTVSSPAAPIAADHGPVEHGD